MFKSSSVTSSEILKEYIIEKCSLVRNLIVFDTPNCRFNT